MTKTPYGVARAAGRLSATLCCLLGAAFLAGCFEGGHVVSALGSSSKPYQEYLDDPATLTTIKTIAVLPFEDHSSESGFDAEEFAVKLANQLAAQGKVRVIYPGEILKEVEKENRSVRRHNARLRERDIFSADPMEKQEEKQRDIFSGGPDGPEESRPRPYYDPVRNLDEAVKLARKAKADAVIVGEVSDFDPYMRPRMSLTMRLVATGSTETAAKAIAEMTQWGIPMSNPGSKGVIYLRQENFDSSIGSVGMDVSKYGRTHYTDGRPYGTELYIRSMPHFYEVVSMQLAKSYVDARNAAVKEAEDRAKKLAKSQNKDQNEAVRRLTAMMERDDRIPDYETDGRGENYFDQAFPNKNAVLAANGGDTRIQSWRPEGRSIRPATPAERLTRDGRIPENERGPGKDGYAAMVDAAFPDADTMMEMNMGDNRDRSWRPDYYNRANPQKSAQMYAPEEFRGGK